MPRAQIHSETISGISVMLPVSSECLTAHIEAVSLIDVACVASASDFPSSSHLLPFRFAPAPVPYSGWRGHVEVWLQRTFDNEP